MSGNDKRKALGRGLAALIPGAPTTSAAHAVLKREFFECAIEDLHPSDDNPRRVFDDTRLAELAESIRNQGLVQPLVVRQRPAQQGGYFIVAGERRWRAAQRAGLKALPVVVKEVSGADAFEMMLVENLQREDLNPIEEAEAYRRLIADHAYTQEKLADRVGKDRASVANALRLLKLPASVRQKVADETLSMGHARALLGLEDGPAIERAAERVIAKHLSVRQTEALVRDGASGGKEKKPKTVIAPSAAVRDLEQRLERALGTRVRVVQKDAQQGTIEVDYHSLDQLDGLLERMLRR